jgi:hypothetical protein
VAARQQPCGTPAHEHAVVRGQIAIAFRHCAHIA